LGGLFVGEQMTRAYMLKVLGRFDVDRDNLKLLDTREAFTGAGRKNVREILSQNFDADSTVNASAEAPISGTKSLIIKEFSPEFELPIKSGEKGWLRASCIFRSDPKEWETWKMTQFVLRFKQGDKIVKERSIRLQRHVDGSEAKAIFFDTRLPDQAFDRAFLFFWNPGSSSTVRIDDLKVEAFE